MEQVNGGWDLLKWVEVNISLPILEKTNEIRKNLNVDTVTDTLKDKMKEVVDKVTGN